MGTPASMHQASLFPFNACTTSSPLTRAWIASDDARGWWTRLRAPFAKRRHRADFEGFKAFVLSFSAEERRPLREQESQGTAREAVLLGLLDVDPTFASQAGRPNFYQLVPGYRRRSANFSFRHWLVLHELRLKAESFPRTSLGSPQVQHAA